MECYLDVATSTKHPFWVFLGTAPDVADLTQIENIEAVVASQTDPQVLAWLSRIGERSLNLHLKFVDEDGGFKTEHCLAQIEPQADGTQLLFLRR